MDRPDASGMKAALLAALVATWFTAHAAPAADAAPTRGELLYTTHCIACHNSQMHWRDQRLATDWASLRAQVRRWQGVANLGWSDDDILEVARHLNDRIYRFPVSGDKVVSQRAESSIGH
jgi:mono/diheme cytochrome c family protein